MKGKFTKLEQKYKNQIANLTDTQDELTQSKLECEKRQKMLAEKDISIKAYKQASLEGQKELSDLQNEHLN